MNTRLVDSLCELVRIPSESGNEAAFLDFLAAKLTRETGASCRKDGYGNLLCFLAGKNSETSEPLLIAAHGDTVAPGVGIAPQLRDGALRSAGDTVLGADCKAGIAEFMEAVLTAERHPPLEFVVTREEEIGFLGAKHLDYGLLRARQGFLLDMDSIDEVVVGGPSAMLITIEVTGRAAHAGMEPEKGISAIKVAGNAIAQLELGRIDEETTANIGTFSSGTATNVVPARASLSAEVRSLDHTKCLNLSHDIGEAFRTAAQKMGATVDINLELLLQAYSLDPETHLVRALLEALRSVGISPRVVKITGGLESTLYNAHGIQIVPIGNGARDEHTTGEHIYPEDMERIVEVIKYLLSRFSTKENART